MDQWIVLLRAIGPATHKVMPMASLRVGCEANGFANVRTLLATGNVLLNADGSEDVIKDRVRSVVRGHGLDNDVFVRSPEQVANALSRDPFPDAVRERPNHLLVLFTVREIGQEAKDRLAQYEGPERFVAHDRELFIDYREGVRRSKLTPATLERRLGQSGTARNWNTVRKILAGIS